MCAEVPLCSSTLADESVDVQDTSLTLWNYHTLKGRLPRDVISIADDEGGNLFCLDLRARGRGRVLFWDHELEEAGQKAALKVVIANSFEAWLAQLTARA